MERNRKAAQDAAPKVTFPVLTESGEAGKVSEEEYERREERVILAAAHTDES